MMPRRVIRQQMYWTLLALCAAFLVLTVFVSLPRTQSDVYPALSRSLVLEDISFPQGSVNVNTAGVKELDTLPGIGPVTAQAIIEEREVNGFFFYPEDILSVKGIGDKTLEKIRDMLALTQQ